MFNRRVFFGAVASLALVLSACSGDAPETGKADTQGQSQSGQEAGPVVDRHPSEKMPKIVGEFGEIPEMKPVNESPPTEITSVVLHEGDGPTVGVDDLVTANYAGYLWDGAGFDSSFSRGGPQTFSLNSVIEGWKYGLADTNVGDRVLLVIPPEYGYGDQEVSESIPANSTLVFVVDIVDILSSDPSVLKDATPTDAELPKGLTVEGNLGEEPEVIFAENAKEPTDEEIITLAEGDGSVIVANESVLYHYVATVWGTDGEANSTWNASPEVIPSENSQFLGEKVGSRLAMILPGEDGSQPAAVIIVDLLGAQKNGDK